MKKQLLTVICIIFISFSYGQNKGYLVAYPKPKEAIIRLDTTKIIPYKASQIDTGQYILKAWAPTYNLFIDTISISSNQYTHSKFKLRHTNNYLKYRAAVRKQKRGFRITSGATLIFAGLGIALHTKTIAFEKDAKSYKASYLGGVSLDDIEKAKADYKKSLDNFKSYRTYRNTSFIAATGIGIIGGYLSYKYYKNHQVEYKEDVPQLSSITPSFDPISNTGTLTAIFLIK